MPDVKQGNGNGDRFQPAQAAPPPVPGEKVKLPPNEAERRKARLDKAAAESDDERSERHAKELAVHFEVHAENVAAAHEKFPKAWLFTRDNLTEFSELSEAEQKEIMDHWNLRRHDIDMANKAYHRHVKQTHADHQEEHRHVRRLFDEAAKKAQETA